MELKFELLHVASQSIATLRATVKHAMSAKRMLMPNEFIPYFDVKNVLYDGESLFASKGAVPAVIFSESSYGVGFVGDDFEPGKVVEIVVKNHAAEIKPIWAVISDNYEDIVKISPKDSDK